MNYQHHYDLLVQRARERTKPEGYVERHHVIPRCMGGNNTSNNLVYLIAREHFVAHQLLMKIYPESTKLVIAAFLMMGGSGERPNNRKYGWLKVRAMLEFSVTGVVGGRKAFENKLGIYAQTIEQRRENSRVGGKTSSGGKQAVINKTGIHALTNEQHKEFSRIGGRRVVLDELGVHALTSAQHQAHGRVGAAVSGAQRWQCSVCSKVTSPGSLGYHQKCTGHAGRVHLKGHTE